MLSVHAETNILSALPAESILVSASPTESMILSALRNPQTLRHGTSLVDNASCLKIANKYIVKTRIFSIFNGVDLSPSMLAN